VVPEIVVEPLTIALGDASVPLNTVAVVTAVEIVSAVANWERKSNVTIFVSPEYFDKSVARILLLETSDQLV
jgi:hypothetical protein